VQGEMTYTMPSENIISINHTEVDEEVRGNDLGLKMVESAATYARAHHLKIFPACRFVKAVFDKNASFEDVWSKG
jgi:predicted GNAT family acetyltransferase